MKTYAWRTNFTSSFSDHEKNVRGKLAFKTKETHWLGTESPVIALVSVHSSFHDDVKGPLKMDAFISTIKKHVKGKVTVLLTDRAHTHTLSLSHQENLEYAFQTCLVDSHSLLNRYKPYFEGCHVAYWHAYICQDKTYPASIQRVRLLYETDDYFRELIHQEAKASYAKEKMQTILDKTLYVEKAKEDLIEQCACVLVMSHKGYRFQFYPGYSCASTEYVNTAFAAIHHPISWIHVFLTIEKKTIIPTSL